jgi:hypothetical protein
LTRLKIRLATTWCSQPGSWTRLLARTAHPTKDSKTGMILEVEPGEAEWNIATVEGLLITSISNRGGRRGGKLSLRKSWGP